MLGGFLLKIYCITLDFGLFMGYLCGKSRDMEEKRIIEVNGVKIEVDLRTAKRVDQFKVGDTVKVLIKSYSDYKSYLGMIVGFDEFDKHPTIIIAYVKAEYSSANIEFAYLNSESKDIEVCAVNEWDMPYTKKDILDKMDREITKKEEEVRELKEKKNYFLNMFGKFFEKPQDASMA